MIDQEEPTSDNYIRLVLQHRLIIASRLQAARSPWCALHKNMHITVEVLHCAKGTNIAESARCLLSHWLYRSLLSSQFFAATHDRQLSSVDGGMLLDAGRTCRRVPRAGGQDSGTKRERERQ